MEVNFVKIGDDRINISEIVSYGIKIGVRYFVKDAGMVETDENNYSTAFTDYEATWKDSDDFLTDPPMFDISGRPVKINGEVIRTGSLSESAYILQEDKYLYVETKNLYGKNQLRKYFASVGNVNIYAKVDEIDRLLIKN